MGFDATGKLSVSNARRLFPCLRIEIFFPMLGLALVVISYVLTRDLIADLRQICKFYEETSMGRL
jgi:hypothetical protein